MMKLLRIKFRTLVDVAGVNLLYHVSRATEIKELRALLSKFF